MDIPKLSAAKLEALYAKRQTACSKNCDALIAAGRGHEKSLETYARGKAGLDRLSVEYVAFSDSIQEVLSEMAERRRWHGSLKPIKRK